MTQLKWLENSTLLFKKIATVHNVGQLSSIVLSEAANIRNNTMEMDLHNNTWAYALCHIPRGESKPVFFCAAVFLLLM